MTDERAASPIGLLAGWGSFPVVFAQKARLLGLPVACVGLRGLAAPELAGMVQSFCWARPTQLGRIIGSFKRAGVRRAVMAGKVFKADILHKPWKILSLWPDCRTVRFWFFRPRRDNRDDSLMLAMIDEFAADGIRFESALDLCPELLVTPGTLTRRRPTAREEADIAFGWELAREMGRLDVGQSVAVKERAVGRSRPSRGPTGPSPGPGSTAGRAASSSSRWPSRTRTCASTCRRWGRRRSRRYTGPAAGCWRSRPGGPSSSTRRRRSPSPTATESASWR
jgi:hypothetical protein